MDGQCWGQKWVSRRAESGDPGEFILWSPLKSRGQGFREGRRFERSQA